MNKNNEPQNYERRYLLLKSQLKYFFQIDTDRIVSDISNELKEVPSGQCRSSTSRHEPTPNTTANATIGKIFSIIFKHVFSEASLYCGFLDPYSYNCFFGENNPGYSELVGLRRLLYITLQNNCIINSFFYELSMASEDITISAANEPLIIHDILEMITDDHYQYKKKKGEVRSQFWGSRKNIFQNECASRPSTYSCAVLNAMTTRTDNDRSLFTLTAKQYLAPISSFLFSQDSCTKFSRSLSNAPISFESYNRTWKDFTEKYESYDKTVDKLIFESEMDLCFGFSFFNDIVSDINKIYNCPLEETHSVKKLEGEVLYNIIEQTANLPLYYNKSIFFKYIYSVFSVYPDINNSYFSYQARDGASELNGPLREEKQTILTLELGQNFIQILGTVTIPLLYSLWDAITYELGRVNPDYNFKITDYANFLSDNYKQISSSYTSIPFDRIRQWEKDIINPKKESTTHESFSINDIYEYYLQGIQKGSFHIHDHKKASCINTDVLSPYLLDKVDNLIKSYCDPTDFAQKRAPLFFTVANKLDTYSSLSPLIEAIVNPKLLENGRIPLSNKEFKLQHQRNIFQYISKK